MITVATGFPTTVNPSLQYGLVPVFIDVDIPTYNARSDMIEAAVSDSASQSFTMYDVGGTGRIYPSYRTTQSGGPVSVEMCLARE